MVYFVSLDSLAELFRPKESKRGKKSSNNKNNTVSYYTCSRTVVLYNGNVTYYANTCLVSFRFVLLFTHSLTRSLARPFCLGVLLAFGLFHSAYKHQHAYIHYRGALTFALILAILLARSVAFSILV